MQLRDEGQISGIQFTNITLETQFVDGDGPGAAEPIYVTALPRTTTTKVLGRAHVTRRSEGLGCAAFLHCWSFLKWGSTTQQVGTVRNVAFVNVTCQAEAGAVIAGSSGDACFRQGSQSACCTVVELCADAVYLESWQWLPKRRKSRT